MNLTGMTFRAVANSTHGTVNTETEMRFTSDEGIVIGSYSGGTVTVGHVLARHINNSEMEMLYHSANISGDIQAGKAHARFSLDNESQMRMYLDWQWLTGDQSQGQSEWVLI
jgi:hypothetical protein